MARHGGDSIVEDENRSTAAVVDGVHEAGDPRMREGGIAYHRDDRPLAKASHELSTVRHAYRCAHVHARVHRRERPERTECVATDVSRNHRALPAQRVEDEAVWTTGAHERRPRRERVIGPAQLRLGQSKRRADGTGSKLSIGGNRHCTDCNAQRTQRPREIVVSLLDHVDPVHPRRELAEKPSRKRKAHPDLENRRLG